MTTSPQSTPLYQPGLLKGKHILVTGGGTGLGRAMSEQFLRLGADISICGRRKGVCDETATALMKAHGGTVTAYGVDIRNAAGRRRHGRATSSRRSR